ncbi:hypothetical protein AB0D08_05315 [Kitasatospora sp. NPDC048540]|uniref:WXG100-like domain-containing protein n=1 Tax=Kitasatospora sp. NPDC048540 TaxID=3155634 RepID=UPI00340A9FD6
MSIMLPPGLAKFFSIATGMKWPEANEDDLRAAGDDYLAIHEKVPELRGYLVDLVNCCRDSFEGKAADAFLLQMRRLIGDTGSTDYVSSSGEVAKQLGDFAHKVANKVEYAKWMIIAQLIQLVAQIAWAIAMIPITFGGSIAEIFVAYKVTGELIKQVFLWLLKQLLLHEFLSITTAMLMDGIIQGIQIGKGHKDRWESESFVQSIEMGAINGLLTGPLELLTFGIGKLFGRMFGSGLTKGLLADIKTLAGSELKGELKTLTTAELDGVLKGLRNAPTSSFQTVLNMVRNDLAEQAAKTAAKDTLGLTWRKELGELAHTAGEGVAQAEKKLDTAALGAVENLGHGFTKVERLSHQMGELFEQGLIKQGVDAQLANAAGRLVAARAAAAGGRYAVDLGAFNKLARTLVETAGQAEGKALESLTKRIASLQNELKGLAGNVAASEAKNLELQGLKDTVKATQDLARTAVGLMDGLHPQTAGQFLYRFGEGVGGWIRGGVQNVLTEGSYNLAFGEDHKFTVSIESFYGGVSMGALGHLGHIAGGPLRLKLQQLDLAMPNYARFPLAVVSTLMGHPTALWRSGPEGTEAGGVPSVKPLDGAPTRPENIKLSSDGRTSGGSAGEERKTAEAPEPPKPVATVGGEGAAPKPAEEESTGHATATAHAETPSPDVPPPSRVVTASAVQHPSPPDYGPASEHGHPLSTGDRSAWVVGKELPDSVQKALELRPKDDTRYALVMHTNADGVPTDGSGRELSPRDVADVIIALGEHGQLGGRKIIDFIACDLNGGDHVHFGAEVMELVWKQPEFAGLKARAADGPVWVAPGFTGEKTMAEGPGTGHLIVAEKVGFDQDGRPVIEGGGNWHEYTRHEDTGGEKPSEIMAIVSTTASKLPEYYTSGEFHESMPGAERFGEVPPKFLQQNRFIKNADGTMKNFGAPGGPEEFRREEVPYRRVSVEGELLGAKRIEDWLADHGKPLTSGTKDLVQEFLERAPRTDYRNDAHEQFWSDARRFAAYRQRTEYVEVMEAVERAGDWMVKEYPPSEYFYLGLGRSPAGVVALLHEQGRDALSMPLSSFRPGPRDETAVVAKGLVNDQGKPNPVPNDRQLDHLDMAFERTLGGLTPERLNGRKVLMIDYVQGAQSLVAAQHYVERYLKGRPGLEHAVVEALALHQDINRGSVDRIIGSITNPERSWREWVLGTPQEVLNDRQAWRDRFHTLDLGKGGPLGEAGDFLGKLLKNEAFDGFAQYRSLKILEADTLWTGSAVRTVELPADKLTQPVGKVRETLAGVFADHYHSTGDREGGQRLRDELETSLKDFLLPGSKDGAKDLAGQLADAYRKRARQETEARAAGRAEAMIHQATAVRTRAEVREGVVPSYDVLREELGNYLKLVRRGESLEEFDSTVPGRWMGDLKLDAARRWDLRETLSRFPVREGVFTVAVHGGADGQPTRDGAPITPEEMAGTLRRLAEDGTWNGTDTLHFVVCDLAGTAGKGYVTEVMRLLGEHNLGTKALAADGKVYFVPKVEGDAVVPAAAGHLVVASHVGYDAAGHPVLVRGGEWLEFRRPTAEDPHPEPVPLDTSDPLRQVPEGYDTVPTERELDPDRHLTGALAFTDGPAHPPQDGTRPDHTAAGPSYRYADAPEHVRAEADGTRAEQWRQTQRDLQDAYDTKLSEAAEQHGKDPDNSAHPLDEAARGRLAEQLAEGSVHLPEHAPADLPAAVHRRAQDMLHGELAARPQDRERILADLDRLVRVAAVRESYVRMARERFERALEATGASKLLGDGTGPTRAPAPLPEAALRAVRTATESGFLARAEAEAARLHARPEDAGEHTAEEAGAQARDSLERLTVRLREELALHADRERALAEADRLVDRAVRDDGWRDRLSAADRDLLAAVGVTGQPKPSDASAAAIKKRLRERVAEDFAGITGPLDATGRRRGRTEAVELFELALGGHIAGLPHEFAVQLARESAIRQAFAEAEQAVESWQSAPGHQALAEHFGVTAGDLHRAKEEAARDLAEALDQQVLEHSDRPAVLRRAIEGLTEAGNIRDLLLHRAARSAAHRIAETAARTAAQEHGVPSEHARDRLAEGHTQRTERAFDELFRTSEDLTGRQEEWARRRSDLDRELVEHAAFERQAAPALRQAARAFDDLARPHVLGEDRAAALRRAYGDEFFTRYRELWTLDQFDAVSWQAHERTHEDAFAHRVPSRVDRTPRFVVRSSFEARRFEHGGEEHTDLTVRIAFREGGGREAAAVWEKLVGGVEEHLNAPGHRLANGDRMHVTVVRVEPGAAAHLTVDLVGRDRPMDQGAWWADAEPLDYVHELGHQLGLRDEYRTADLPHRPDVDGSLAGNPHAPAPQGLRQGGLRDRHLQLISSVVGYLDRHPGDGAGHRSWDEARDAAAPQARSHVWVDPVSVPKLHDGTHEATEVAPLAPPDGKTRIIKQPGYSSGDQFGIAAALLHDPNLHVVIGRGPARGADGHDSRDKSEEILKFYKSIRIPADRIHVADVPSMRTKDLYNSLDPQAKDIARKVLKISPADLPEAIKDTQYGTEVVGGGFGGKLREDLREAWGLHPDHRAVTDAHDAEIANWLTAKGVTLPEHRGKVLVLWSRFTGKKSHWDDVKGRMEHDTSFEGTRQLLRMAGGYYDAVVITGDPHPRRPNKWQELVQQMAGELPGVKFHDITGFWEHDAAVARWTEGNRIGQLRLYDYLHRNHALSHLGARSGNLESVALIGHHVRYLEERGATGSKRMEHWHARPSGLTRGGATPPGYERVQITESPTASGRYASPFDSRRPGHTEFAPPSGIDLRRKPVGVYGKDRGLDLESVNKVLESLGHQPSDGTSEWFHQKRLEYLQQRYEKVRQEVEGFLGDGRNRRETRDLRNEAKRAIDQLEEILYADRKPGQTSKEHYENLVKKVLPKLAQLWRAKRDLEDSRTLIGEGYRIVAAGHDGDSFYKALVLSQVEGVTAHGNDAAKVRDLRTLLHAWIGEHKEAVEGIAGPHGLTVGDVQWTVRTGGQPAGNLGDVIPRIVASAVRVRLNIFDGNELRTFEPEGAPTAAGEPQEVVLLAGDKRYSLLGRIDTAATGSKRLHESDSEGENQEEKRTRPQAPTEQEISNAAQGIHALQIDPQGDGSNPGRPLQGRTGKPYGWVLDGSALPGFSHLLGSEGAFRLVVHTDDDGWPTVNGQRVTADRMADWANWLYQSKHWNGTDPLEFDACRLASLTTEDGTGYLEAVGGALVGMGYSYVRLRSFTEDVWFAPTFVQHTGDAPRELGNRAFVTAAEVGYDAMGRPVVSGPGKRVSVDSWPDEAGQPVHHRWDPGQAEQPPRVYAEVAAGQVTRPLPEGLRFARRRGTSDGEDGYDGDTESLAGDGDRRPVEDRGYDGDVDTQSEGESQSDTGHERRLQLEREYERKLELERQERERELEDRRRLLREQRDRELEERRELERQRLEQERQRLEREESERQERAEQARQELERQRLEREERERQEHELELRRPAAVLDGRHRQYLEGMKIVGEPGPDAVRARVHELLGAAGNDRQVRRQLDAVLDPANFRAKHAEMVNGGWHTTVWVSGRQHELVVAAEAAAWQLRTTGEEDAENTGEGFEVVSEAAHESDPRMVQLTTNRAGLDLAPTGIHPINSTLQSVHTVSVALGGASHGMESALKVTASAANKVALVGRTDTYASEFSYRVRVLDEQGRELTPPPEGHPPITAEVTAEIPHSSAVHGPALRWQGWDRPAGGPPVGAGRPVGGHPLAIRGLHAVRDAVFAALPQERRPDGTAHRAVVDFLSTKNVVDGFEHASSWGLDSPDLRLTDGRTGRLRLTVEPLESTLQVLTDSRSVLGAKWSAEQAANRSEGSNRSVGTNHGLSGQIWKSDAPLSKESKWLTGSLGYGYTGATSHGTKGKNTLTLEHGHEVQSRADLVSTTVRFRVQLIEDHLSPGTDGLFHSRVTDIPLPEHTTGEVVRISPLWEPAEVPAGDAPQQDALTGPGLRSRTAYLNVPGSTELVTHVVRYLDTHAPGLLPPPGGRPTAVLTPRAHANLRSLHEQLSPSALRAAAPDLLEGAFRIVLEAPRLPGFPEHGYEILVRADLGAGRPLGTGPATAKEVVTRTVGADKSVSLGGKHAWSAGGSLRTALNPPNTQRAFVTVGLEYARGNSHQLTTGAETEVKQDFSLEATTDRIAYPVTLGVDIGPLDPRAPRTRLGSGEPQEPLPVGDLVVGVQRVQQADGLPAELEPANLPVLHLVRDVGTANFRDRVEEALRSAYTARKDGTEAPEDLREAVDVLADRRRLTGILQASRHGWVNTMDLHVGSGRNRDTVGLSLHTDLGTLRYRETLTGEGKLALELKSSTSSATADKNTSTTKGNLAADFGRFPETPEGLNTSTYQLRGGGKPKGSFGSEYSDTVKEKTSTTRKLAQKGTWHVYEATATITVKGRVTDPDGNVGHGAGQLSEHHTVLVLLSDADARAMATPLAGPVPDPREAHLLEQGVGAGTVVEFHDSNAILREIDSQLRGRQPDGAPLRDPDAALPFAEAFSAHSLSANFDDLVNKGILDHYVQETRTGRIVTRVLVRGLVEGGWQDAQQQSTMEITRKTGIARTVKGNDGTNRSAGLDLNFRPSYGVPRAAEHFGSATYAPTLGGELGGGTGHESGITTKVGHKTSKFGATRLFTARMRFEVTVTRQEHGRYVDLDAPVPVTPDRPVKAWVPESMTTAPGAVAPVVPQEQQPAPGPEHAGAIPLQQIVVQDPAAWARSLASGHDLVGFDRTNTLLDSAVTLLNAPRPWGDGMLGTLGRNAARIYEPVHGLVGSMAADAVSAVVPERVVAMARKTVASFVTDSRLAEDHPLRTESGLPLATQSALRQALSPQTLHAVFHRLKDRAAGYETVAIGQDGRTRLRVGLEAVGDVTEIAVRPRGEDELTGTTELESATTGTGTVTWNATPFDVAATTTAPIATVPVNTARYGGTSTFDRRTPVTYAPGAPHADLPIGGVPHDKAPTEPGKATLTGEQALLRQPVRFTLRRIDGDGPYGDPVPVEGNLYYWAARPTVTEVQSTVHVQEGHHEGDGQTPPQPHREHQSEQLTVEQEIELALNPGAARPVVTEQPVHMDTVRFTEGHRVHLLMDPPARASDAHRDLLEALRALPHDDPYLTLVFHGHPEDGAPLLNGERVTPERFAGELLRLAENGRWTGEDVRFLSCNSAVGGARSFAGRTMMALHELIAAHRVEAVRTGQPLAEHLAALTRPVAFAGDGSVFLTGGQDARAVVARNVGFGADGRPLVDGPGNWLRLQVEGGEVRVTEAGQELLRPDQEPVPPVTDHNPVDPDRPAPVRLVDQPDQGAVPQNQAPARVDWRSLRARARELVADEETRILLPTGWHEQQLLDTEGGTPTERWIDPLLYDYGTGHAALERMEANLRRALGAMPESGRVATVAITRPDGDFRLRVERTGADTLRWRRDGQEADWDPAGEDLTDAHVWAVTAGDHVRGTELATVLDPGTTYVIKAENSGDMYHVRAGLVVKPGHSLLIWNVGQDTAEQAEGMLNLHDDMIKAGRRVLYTTAKQLPQRFGRKETQASEDVANHFTPRSEPELIGYKTGMQRLMRAWPVGEPRPADLPGVLGDGPATLLAAVRTIHDRAEAHTLHRSLEEHFESRREGLQRLRDGHLRAWFQDWDRAFFDGFGHYSAEEGAAFETDLTAVDRGGLRHGQKYVIVTYRGSGHSGRAGANAPALDTGEHGVREVIAEVRAALGPEVEVVLMGEKPEDWTGPSLREYWNWPSAGNRRKELALLRYLEREFDVVGAVGMRSGVIDQMAFAGIKVVSVDVSPHRDEGDGLPKVAQSKGWTRGLRFEDAMGRLYGRMFLIHPRADDTLLGGGEFPGHFHPEDRDAIRHSVGFYLGHSEDERGIADRSHPHRTPQVEAGIGRMRGIDSMTGMELGRRALPYLNELKSFRARLPAEAWALVEPSVEAAEIAAAGFRHEAGELCRAQVTGFPQGLSAFTVTAASDLLRKGAFLRLQLGTADEATLKEVRAALLKGAADAAKPWVRAATPERLLAVLEICLRRYGWTPDMQPEPQDDE